MSTGQGPPSGRWSLPQGAVSLCFIHLRHLLQPGRGVRRTPSRALLWAPIFLTRGASLKCSLKPALVSQCMMAECLV